MVLAMPAKTLPDLRRTYKAMVRLTVSERNQIKRCSKGKPLSTYIREVSLQASSACKPEGR